MTPSLADTVLETAGVTRDLVSADPVAERWDAESSCAGLTVGGLAHHLASQTTNLVRLLAADPHDGTPVSVRHHYRNAPWANTGLDDEANVAIREDSDRAAAGARADVVAALATGLAALPDVLAARTDDDPVLIPWQGWALSAHDFAVTRLMEMVVHADDLASSVDLPTPSFPDEAVRLVLGLLTEVAVDRHGQVAVLRALSRPQRAPASVSAF